MSPGVRWFSVVLALLLGSGELIAASQAENRAFAPAAQSFNLGFWERAEREFAEFVQKFPNSTRVPEAILLQAQARFQQKNFSGAIDLLSAHRDPAAPLADQYRYWLAESHFEQKNYPTAADLFSRLVQDFPASNKRLEAALGEAATRAKLGEWTRVRELLQQTNGVFQSSVQSGVTNDNISRGFLLLTQAQLEQKDLPSAADTLQLLSARSLSPKLDWERRYLQCLLQVARAQLEPALQDTTKLISAATNANDPALHAQSIALQAGIYQALGRHAEAIAAYDRNLSGASSAEYQRQALFKIAELALIQTNWSEARQTLEKFLSRFPNSTAADVAMFTLGELHLKEFVARAGANGGTNKTFSAVAATNLLQQAQARFDAVLNAFTNSPLAGRSLLNKGYCLWLDGKIAESRDAFQAAVNKLPSSKDQAIARFKLGDAQFQLNDFIGALSNYTAVVEQYAAMEEVKTNLVEPALYQIVRASNDAGLDASAINGVNRILDWFPDSFLTEASVLFTGQGVGRRGNPPLARQIYQNYLQRVPQSTNRAQVELAIARTYEQENNWEAAIRQYDGWLQSFTNHDARPRAEYLRAYANFQDGRDTNALTLFANMAAQFPADPLAPLAQWWVAGYYFEHGDLVNAEKNYQLVFKNWPTSNLKYQAYMWAGRAAFARNSPKDAIDYFTNITSKLDCPADLRAQAMFAYGDALMSLGPPESVRANLGEAIRVFRQLQQTYPESAQAVLAWGAIGNCYKQLGDFEQAANEYEQLLNSPRADVAARSQAIYGLADIVEKQAQGAGGEEQLRLLNRALDYYLDVLNEKNLRDGEVRDFFWTKKAGLDAERLAEALQNWNSAAKIYERLQDLFPPQREAFERKRLKVLEHTRDKN